MPKPKKQRKESYEALKKVWYAKLLTVGFDDIEQANGALKGDDNSQLEPTYDRSPISTRKVYSSLVWKQSQAEYYRRAGHYLHDGDFLEPQHKQLWSLHCDGLTYPEIAKKLNITWLQVRHRIYQIRNKAGLKGY